MVRDGTISWVWGIAGVQLSHKGQGQLSWCSVISSKGQGHLSQVLWRVWLTQYSPLTPTCKILTARCVNIGHSHQHKPQLQKDHGLRHGSRQQLRPRCCSGLGDNQIRMALPASRPLTSTWAPMSPWSWVASRPPTSACSSLPLLLTAREPLFLSLPSLHHLFSHHYGSYWPSVDKPVSINIFKWKFRVTGMRLPSISQGEVGEESKGTIGEEQWNHRAVGEPEKTGCSPELYHN